MAQDVISLAQARRIALAAQGFDRPRPAGVGADHIRQVIRQLGLIQIDFVNVLVPAHYLVIFSRLGPYRRTLFDTVVYGGKRWHERDKPREFTEQWAHEASIIPVEIWPLLRHRMEVHRPRPWGFERFLEEHADYARWALEEVRVRGPLAADGLAAAENVPGIERGQFGRIPGAWHGSVQRAVLEAHFGRGLLAVTERRANFARAFDLAERLIAAEHHGRRVEQDEAERELLRRAARSFGVGTADDLADYYRMPIRAARARLKELVDVGELREVRVEGWRGAAFLHHEASAPREIGAAALLSPFDPLVWYRPRVERLFSFDYRIEIFVPQPKRKWGYYVLPFLLGDRLVARVDLKADRAEDCLLVLAAYLEPAIRQRTDKKKFGSAREPGVDYRPAAVAESLAQELQTLAGWLGLSSIAVGRGGDFTHQLAAALDA
ncbi:MAG TPA: crosslink repair DNA glycosylase YcaQ family protein [Terriglobia bacterium]|nr:crosslink repair DNA glycosylase YcaQ family protein [Terriglobia bacterium]